MPGAGLRDPLQLLLQAGAGAVQRAAHRVQLRQVGGCGVVLQPQALAQDFLHGAAHRVLVVAGHRFDLVACGAQARLQGVGGIQQFADRALAALAALANAPAQPQDDGDDGEQECGQEEFHPASLRERRPRGKPAPRKCRIMLI